MAVYDKRCRSYEESELPIDYQQMSTGHIWAHCEDAGKGASKYGSPPIELQTRRQ